MLGKEVMLYLFLNFCSLFTTLGVTLLNFVVDFLLHLDYTSLQSYDLKEFI